MSTIKQASKYYKNGNYAKVIELCKKVLAKSPDANALRLMGLSLFKKNLIRDSLAMFDYALRVDPNNLELQLDKVEAMIKLGESADYSSYIKAAWTLRKITKANPSHFKAHRQLKDIYQKLFFNNSSEKVILSFLDANPDSGEMLYEYYSFLIMLGRFDEAKIILDKAIAISSIYALDPTWEKVNKGHDPQERIDNLIKINESINVNDFFKAFYYLSRGLAHQRKKEFESAFRYLKKANLKYRSRVEYSINKYISQFQHLARSFTKENYETLKSHSKSFTEPDLVPVFIVGLPRSGSTLIESILSAHDEVEGVGEINDFRENLVTTLAETSENLSLYSYRLDNISAETLLTLRDRYLKLLKTKNSRVNPGSKAKYLINKMLTNYQYIPLIKAMFPNAKIIHAKRHPIDTIWSGFKIFFNGDDNYLYNLLESANHYNLYRSLVDHWKSFMGDDFMTVDHEKLTKNPKEEIQRLLDYCDLEWSDKCLNFHKEIKEVRTASFEQVRNPITHKERMAWQDYEPYLKELISAIKPEYLEEYK